MPTLHRSTPLALALLAALPLFGACQSLGGGKNEEQDVAWLVRHERYAEAVRLAEARWSEDPDDPQRTEEYRISSVALLMARARTDLFADRDVEALEGFLRAYELAPEQENVAAWVLKTRRKLSVKMAREASGLHVADDLDGAMIAYESALTYDPQNSRAKHGLQRALLQANHRRGMGVAYYEDGIAAFHGLWLDQASSSFSYSLKYAPDDERAQMRRDEVLEQLAIQRITLAQQFEDENRCAAARNEFRMALLLDEDNAVALGGLARMTVETKAADHLRSAGQAFTREEFDDALESVSLARDMSARLDDDCDDMEAAIELARLGQIYDRARVLESDQRFEDAVKVYAELLDQAPYFRDSIARRDTLDDYVLEAGVLYEQASGAETPEAQLSLLRRIAIFWPEYRDVAARLAVLEQTVNG